MRVLVSGGSGFIGTNLCEAVLRRGGALCSIDAAAPRNGDHVPYWREVDVLDSARLSDSVEQYRPDIIFHLAARTDLDGRTISDYAANTRGVENMIEAAAACRSVQVVVFASSRLVCRIGYMPSRDDDYCPSTVYGQSKAIGEQTVRARASGRHFDWMIVRPTSIWGPWFGTPYRQFFDTVTRGRYLHPRGHQVYKSFGYVENSVHQLLKLVEAPRDLTRARTFYLADYPPVDVLAMARQIRAATGQDEVVREVPIGLLQAAATLGDGLKWLGWKNPPLTRFRLANLVTPMVHGLDSLEQLVGELPYSMAAGVERTVDWMRGQGTVH